MLQRENNFIADLIARILIVFYNHKTFDATICLHYLFIFFEYFTHKTVGRRENITKKLLRTY